MQTLPPHHVFREIGGGGMFYGRDFGSFLETLFGRSSFGAVVRPFIAHKGRFRSFLQILLAYYRGLP